MTLRPTWTATLKRHPFAGVVKNFDYVDNIEKMLTKVSLKKDFCEGIVTHGRKWRKKVKFSLKNDGWKGTEK